MRRYCFWFNNPIGKGLKQITENPEVQEKMKKQLEELKESEISKKSLSAYETVKNDEQTKKVWLSYYSDV